MKCVNVLLISNENDWKADFVNFHMTRLHCKSALEKCTKTIKQDVVNKAGLPVSYGHANVNSPVRISFTLKDQEIVLISPAATRERKKSQWPKTLANLTHVDAVLCMLASQHPSKPVMDTFDILLDFVERDVLKRTFFTKGDSSLSLQQLNEEFGAKFKVTFTERNLFEYDYPVYPKQILQLKVKRFCVSEHLATSAAVKSFDPLFKRIRKLANGRLARNVVFSAVDRQHMRNLHELFEALCLFFATVQQRMSIALKCSDKGKKTVSVVCNKNCDETKKIATDCPFEQYYARYYKKLFEEVVGKKQVLFIDTETNEEVLSLVVRCLSLITQFRRRMLNCIKDPYIEYVLSNPDRKNIVTYEHLYKLYKVELETPVENAKTDLSNCLAQLLEYPNVVSILETKKITRINIHLLRAWILLVALQDETIVQDKKRNTQDKEKKPQDKKMNTQEVTSIKETVECVQNGGTLKSLHDLKKTIVEFTDEMTELRKSCSKNNDSVSKLAVRLQMTNLVE